MKRLICLSFVIGYCFLIFIPAWAAVPAAENPICWLKEACKKQIEAKEGWTFTDNNWIPNDPPACDGKFGSCIPAGKTQLSIKVGTQFKEGGYDLGDYIQTVYNYLIYIGATIAVVLIVKGGFEYLTSAGNKTRVDSAKSTISNALIGLILVFGSYTLLYTINPDLLRLKLPRTYMIRPIAIGADWCRDLGPKAIMALAYPNPKPADFKKNSSEIKTEDYGTINLSRALQYEQGSIDSWIKEGLVPACNKQYFWENSGDKTCAGDACPLSTDGKSQVCVKTGAEYQCKKGNLTGTFKGTEGMWEYPWVGAMGIILVCNNGGLFSLANQTLSEITDNNKEQSQSYIIIFDESKMIGDKTLNNLCTEYSGTKGILLFFTTNGNGLHIGKHLIVGKSGASQCNTVIAESSTNEEEQKIETEKLRQADPGKFLSVDELKRGSVCDINVDDQMQVPK